MFLSLVVQFQRCFLIRRHLLDYSAEVVGSSYQQSRICVLSSVTESVGT